MKNIDCITLENNQDYIIVEEIENKEYTYLYLTNENDSKDFCIRKTKDNLLYGLENEEEFRFALNLLKEKNASIIEKLNLE